MPVNGVSGAVPSISSVTSVAAGTPAAASPGFGESLEQMLKAVQTTGDQANDAVANMLAGNGDVHSALIAMQNADTTFQLTVQVRNKLVQAYQDIMRMPI
jgi:flagellar hook-basal body complex protein FliE